MMAAFVFLLKPDRLRYWLRSVALRDADEHWPTCGHKGFRGLIMLANVSEAPGRTGALCRDVHLPATFIHALIDFIANELPRLAGSSRTGRLRLPRPS